MASGPPSPPPVWARRLRPTPQRKRRAASDPDDHQDHLRSSPTRSRSIGATAAGADQTTTSEVEPTFRPRRYPLTKRNLRWLQQLQPPEYMLPPDQEEEKEQAPKPTPALARGREQSSEVILPHVSISQHGALLSVTPSKSTSLNGDPLEFSNLLFEEHGVFDYGFEAPSDPGRAGTDLTEHLPSNLAVIHEALARPRDDLPRLADWPWNVMAGGQETDVSSLTDPFLGRAMGTPDRQGAQMALVDLAHHLPAGHGTLRPDRLVGLLPQRLKTHIWLQRGLNRFLEKKTIICVNEVHEFKSSTGQLVKARIQNRAAASILCRAWQQFDERILDQATRSLGLAQVGSICTDGVLVEAAVHWMTRSESESGVGGPFDIHSYRVVMAVPLAASLAQYQDAYQQVANFTDWLREVRLERVNTIRTLVPAQKTTEMEAAIEAMLPPPPPPSPPVPPSSTSDRAPAPSSSG
ncbi:MAG: hypothetical protein M1823_004833 [Watsoniomyces obsoletus]|nr:MAG: hypothetical protein M1823_004833 [Watsoniomyces obsoletus]